MAAKYGPEIIEITVDLAETIDPGYPEEDEELPDEEEES